MMQMGVFIVGMVIIGLWIIDCIIEKKKRKEEENAKRNVLCTGETGTGEVQRNASCGGCGYCKRR